MPYFYAPIFFLDLSTNCFAPERASYSKKKKNSKHMHLYEIVEAYWLIGISLLPIKRSVLGYFRTFPFVNITAAVSIEKCMFVTRFN